MKSKKKKGRKKKNRKKEDEKQNQHFVPSSFLKSFTIETEKSLIWGYDKKYNKCTGKRSINNICSSEYYYEQIKPDGTKTQTLEDGFQTIETPAIEIIRSLSPSYKLLPEEKGCLSFYIGLLLTRGPSFRDGIHDYHKHGVKIILQKEYESGKLPKPPAILKKHIVNNDITSVVKTEILPHVSLQYMIDIANNIGQSLCNKKWDFYYIQNSECFVTSDTPVMFEHINPNENPSVGPAHPHSLILCTITKKMLIAVRPYFESDCSAYEFKPIESEMVNTINKMMCFNAQRYIYSPEKSQELLECIKETKGRSKKFRVYRFGDALIPMWDIGKDG